MSPGSVIATANAAEQRVRFALEALGLLLGALTLLLGLWVIHDFPSPQEADARRNAGHVLNGDRLALDAASAIDALLARSTPQVVVLGNSLANNAIRADLLAARLGLERSQVQLLTVPGSIGAHWAAILENRVYEAGHRPRLVLVVGSLQNLLEATPASTASAVNLEVQLRADDAHLRERAWPAWSSHAALSRFAVDRSAARTFLLEQVRGVMAGTYAGRTGWNDRILVGNQLADQAHDEVFAPARLDWSRHAGQSAWRTAPPALPAVDEGFVPLLAQTAARMNSRLVFVRTPLSPLVPPEEADVVPPGTEAAVAAALAPAGRLLDLGDFELGASNYRDPVHMRPPGAERFTRVVAAHLAAWRAVAPGNLWWNERFEPSSPPSPVVEAGQSAVVSFAQRFPSPGERFKVEARLLTAQEAPPQLEVEGHSVPLRWDGRAWVADAWVPTPSTEAWSITLRAGAAPVRWGALALGEFDFASQVLGERADLRGRSWDLVAPGQRPFEFQVGPPAGLPPRPFLPGPRSSGVYATPGFGALTEQLAEDGAATGLACSPFQVVVGDRLLPARLVSCAELAHGGEGGSCFDGERVVFVPNDRRRVAPEEAYLRHHPRRACPGGVWLYPGDVLRFRLAAAEVRANLGGPPERLGFATLAAGPAEVEVQLTQGGRTLLRQEHRAQVDDRSGFLRRLQGEFTEEPLELTLRNPSEGYLLVRHLALRRDP